MPALPRPPADCQPAALLNELIARWATSRFGPTTPLREGRRVLLCGTSGVSLPLSQAIAGLLPTQVRLEIRTYKRPLSESNAPLRDTNAVHEPLC
jgi:hypothetical protein